MNLIIKVGKKKFINLNLINLIAETLNYSKAEVKRLFKQKAIDIYLEIK